MVFNNLLFILISSISTSDQNGIRILLKADLDCHQVRWKLKMAADIYDKA